jgi:hypothetical protein
VEEGGGVVRGRRGGEGRQGREGDVRRERVWVG